MVTVKKTTSFLNNIPLGEKCVIERLLTEGTHRRRLMDLGFTKGAMIEVVQKSPFGSLRAYEIRGTVIALRTEDTSKIEVTY